MDRNELAMNRCFLLARIAQSSSVWDSRRWKAFLLYTESFKLRDVSTAESELDHIRAFLNDTAEPVHFRVEAALTLARWYANEGDGEMRDEGAFIDCYRQAFELIQHTTVEEREQRIPKLLESAGNRASSTGDWTVGELLEDKRLHIEAAIRQMEVPTSILNKDVASSNTLLAEFMDKRLSVGGVHCDSCGKTREESGLSKLLCCSRCNMTYYCSTECQTKQWRAGHKEACRREGEIKPKDVMHVRGMPWCEGAFVVVFRAVGNKKKKMWKVKRLRLSDLRPLKEDYRHMCASELAHIRPAK